MKKPSLESASSPLIYKLHLLPLIAIPLGAPCAARHWCCRHLSPGRGGCCSCEPRKGRLGGYRWAEPPALTCMAAGLPATRAWGKLLSRDCKHPRGSPDPRHVQPLSSLGECLERKAIQLFSLSFIGRSRNKFLLGIFAQQYTARFGSWPDGVFGRAWCSLVAPLSKRIPKNAIAKTDFSIKAEKLTCPAKS